MRVGQITFEMKSQKIYNFLNYLFAFVWFVNGFFCKILNLVPRHQEIVGRILGKEYSTLFTVIIGILEILMAVWILSNLLSKLNALLQIIMILTMNIIEFFLVSDLLLWGKLNVVFALFFVTLIYYKEFILKKKLQNASIS